MITTDKAIDALKKRISPYTNCAADAEANEVIEMAIKALKQEPKTGHWTNGDPICPCCGENKFKGLDADIWADWRPNYCPNCGAKMESED